MRSALPGPPLTLGEGVSCPLPGLHLPPSSPVQLPLCGHSCCPKCQHTSASCSCSESFSTSACLRRHPAPYCPVFPPRFAARALCPAAQSGTLVPGHAWPSAFARPLPSAASRVPLPSWQLFSSLKTCGRGPRGAVTCGHGSCPRRSLLYTPASRMGRSQSAAPLCVLRTQLVVDVPSGVTSSPLTW